MESACLGKNPACPMPCICMYVSRNQMTAPKQCVPSLLRIKACLHLEALGAGRWANIGACPFSSLRMGMQKARIVEQGLSLEFIGPVASRARATYTGQGARIMAGLGGSARG